MQSDRMASANGHRVSSANVRFARDAGGPAGHVPASGGGDRHAQRGRVDLPSRATALKAENLELRAEIVRLRDIGVLGAGGRPSGRWRAGRAGDRSGRSGAWRGSRLRGPVPGAAGRGVRCGQREAARVRARHQQLATQRRSEDEVIVSVELMPDWFRIGVQDSGSDAVIAARTAGPGHRGGFGLNLVAMLSERWGVERLAGGGTQVWAQLLRSGRDEAAARAQTVRDPRDPGGLTVAFDRRLTRLRVLVDRLERLPASAATGVDARGSASADGRRRDG